MDRVRDGLVAIWADALELPVVATDEDFFALGGDSIDAMTVAARIQEQFAVPLPVSAIFESSTIDGLAARIHAALGVGAYSMIVRRGAVEQLLSFAQRRLWFLDALAPGTAAYNLPAIFELHRNLDIPRVELAIARVIARHDILRARIIAVDGEPRQVVDADRPFVMSISDVRGYPEPLVRAAALAKRSRRRLLTCPAAI